QGGNPPPPRIIRLALEPVIQDMRVHSWNGDRGASPDDDQHHQRKNDPLTKLRNLKDIRESRDHQNTRLSTENNCSPGLLDLLTGRLAEFISFYRQFLGELAAP